MHIIATTPNSQLLDMHDHRHPMAGFLVCTLLLGCSGPDLRKVYGVGDLEYVCFSFPGSEWQPYVHENVVGTLQAYERDSHGCTEARLMNVLRFERADGPDFVVGIESPEPIDWSAFIGAELSVSMLAGFSGDGTVSLVIRDSNGSLLLAMRRADIGSSVEEIVPITIDSGGTKLGSSDTRCATYTYRALVVESDHETKSVVPGSEIDVASSVGSFVVRCHRNERLTDFQCTDLGSSLVAYTIVAR